MDKFPGGGYGAEMTRTDSPMGLRRATVREQLEQQLKYHENQVTKIHEAIGLLQRNPDMEKFTDLMAEIR